MTWRSKWSKNSRNRSRINMHSAIFSTRTYSWPGNQTLGAPRSKVLSAKRQAASPAWNRIKRDTTNLGPGSQKPEPRSHILPIKSDMLSHEKRTYTKWNHISGINNLPQIFTSSPWRLCTCTVRALHELRDEGHQEDDQRPPHQHLAMESPEA